MTEQQEGLASQYAPAEVEARRYEHWEKAGYFTPESLGNAAQENPDAPSYTIVLPPPNVTGILHIGHALNHTLSDILVRRRRMQGYRTLWLPGMDHAGIATQNVVERELAKEGLSRHDLGREAFVDRVWQWKGEYGGRILSQMRRLGDSVDWSRERFTMDEGLSRAVQTIFKRLYDDGLIYRAERIINWCPRCLTALSDIEVDHSDDDGELVSIRYGDGDDSIVVATTRAETMLGDTAVAVHPDDERYTRLVGTEVELPLTGRRIPIVADAHVDPSFGTGAVKVTPAHDPNDFEIGRRHDLPVLSVMDEHGVITAHGPFEGLDRLEARPAVIAALREDGRIVKEIRPYVHAVGHCSRCSTTVEPRLSLQWFVSVAPLAKAAGDAVRDGRVQISPPEMNARYFGWVDDMHDWCISRQLWWGHRIPVWYGPDGEARCVGPDETPPEGWTQDPDVLDTWFSSALWPFSTLGWPDDTPDLRAFYPTSVLITAYDILFFWVARMMMFGLYAMRGKAQYPSGGTTPQAPRRTPEDAVPFKTIALHGLVRDQFGKKMSKSKGNVVDPIDWMERFGTDATRFTLARGATPGSDEAISEDWAAGSRNFCNKLWNATRFALLNGASARQAGGEPPVVGDLSVTDRWILSRLSGVIAEVDGLLEQFEFGKACEALYHFAWDEFCDWYLELAKVPLASGDETAAAGTRAVLGFVLDQMLRLLHPVMPFVTDELWCALTGEDSVMVAAWPRFEFTDAVAEAEIGSLMRLVTEIRQFRSGQGLRPGQRVPARLVGLEATPLRAHEESIRALLRLTVPERTGPERTGPEHQDGFAASASLLAEGVTVELDLAGTVDVAAERKRLEQGPRGGAQGGAVDDRQARQRGVHREGARRRHREVQGPPRDGRGGHRPAGVPASSPVISRGRSPVPPMFVPTGLIAKTAIVSGPPARTRNPGLTRNHRNTHLGGRSRLMPVDDIAERLREVELEIGSRRAEHQIDPTLDRVAALVSLLGDPHRAFPIVHVTGTNGKTSTTRMIESLLRERGLRTGRFTSPHLVSMRERICVDGEPLSAERFIELYEEISPYVQLVDDQQPASMSFFEVLTGMMFAAFADAPVDVAVIEVGMGGRWDATNVGDGQVAVIMPVAMDHMRWLGDTIEEIATEKAGIIKPGATAVIAQQQVAAAEILLQRAALVGATVAREGFEFGVLTREVAVGGQQLVLQGLRGIVRRRVPAAVRRAPGVQRRVRAGGRRGVRRRGGDGAWGGRVHDHARPWPVDRGPRPGPGPCRVRQGELSRTARHPAALADGHRGRGS